MPERTPPALARRIDYWRCIVAAVLPAAIKAATGSRPALAALVVAAAAAVGVALTASSPVLVVIAVGSFVVAVAEATFHEWDRWAPAAQPRLTVARHDWSGYAGVLVTNDDVEATFRAHVIDVRGPDEATLRWGPSDIWPLQLGWGDALTREVHLVRGESAKIHVVDFGRLSVGTGETPNGTESVYAPAYVFRGPAAEHKLPMKTPDGKLQNMIEVVIEYVRVTPVSARLRKSERIEYPRPYDAEA